jgi:hypothetical protein
MMFNEGTQHECKCIRKYICNDLHVKMGHRKTLMELRGDILYKCPTKPKEHSKLNCSKVMRTNSGVSKYMSCTEIFKDYNTLTVAL